MPTYDIYRETRCRERYYVNAETPEEALAKFEAGGEDGVWVRAWVLILNDEVPVDG